MAVVAEEKSTCTLVMSVPGAKVAVKAWPTGVMPLLSPLGTETDTSCLLVPVRMSEVRPCSVSMLSIWPPARHRVANHRRGRALFRPTELQ